MAGAPSTRLASAARTSTSWQRQIVWCLLFALPLAGLSSVLQSVFGSTHFHRQSQPAVSALADWQDFRRVDHAFALGHPAPGHATWSRHHHAVADPTVASIDGGSADTVLGEAASSSSGSPMVWAIGAGFEIRKPAGSALNWPRLVHESVASRTTDPLERPPRT